MDEMGNEVQVPSAAHAPRPEQCDLALPRRNEKEEEVGLVCPSLSRGALAAGFSVYP